MFRLLKLVVLLVAFPVQLWAQQAQLDVGAVSGTAGSTVSLPLDLSTNQAIAAVQFDLTYSSTLLNPTGVTLGGAAGDHLIASAKVGAVFRVVIYSPTNAALVPGRLANVSFAIAGGSAPQTTPVAIQAVVLSSAAASLIPTTSLNPGSISITSSSVAALTIANTQTSGPNPVSSAGSVLGYTIQVSNTGTQSQTGVSVTASHPDGSAAPLSGPAESVVTNGILDVGEIWTYTSSYTVTQTNITAGAALVSTARVVTAQVPGPTSATATTSISAQAATLTIDNSQTSGPNPATTAGAVLGYTIVVQNTGSVDQTGVTVTGTLPDGTTAPLSGPVQSVTSNSSLEVGETWTYTTSYTVTQANVTAGAPLVNTARVVTTQVPGPTTATAVTFTQDPAVIFRNGFETLPAVKWAFDGGIEHLLADFTLRPDFMGGTVLEGTSTSPGWRPAFQIEVRENVNFIEIRAIVSSGSGNESSAWYPIEPNSELSVHWWSERPPGATNGGLRLWSNGRLLVDLEKIANNGVRISDLRTTTADGRYTGPLSEGALQTLRVLEVER